MCSGCGYHRSLTNDPSVDWAIEDERCEVCAAMDRWRRIQRDVDEKKHAELGKNVLPDHELPEDGRHTVVRLVSVGDEAGD